MHNTDSIHHHYILAKFNTSNTSDNTPFNTSWLVSLHYSTSHHGCSIHPATLASQYIEYILPWTCNTANSTSCKFSIHLNTSSVPQLIHPGAIINTPFNTSCKEYIWNPVHLDRIGQIGTYWYVPVRTSTTQYKAVRESRSHT